jgi:hypothetical protein
VVAVESAGIYLAVHLTGKDHDGEGHFVSVGAGGWDGEHRPSWVNLDRVIRVIRVIRVREGGMRRPCRASRSSGSWVDCISSTARASPRGFADWVTARKYVGSATSYIRDFDDQHRAAHLLDVRMYHTAISGHHGRAWPFAS